MLINQIPMLAVVFSIVIIGEVNRKATTTLLSSVLLVLVAPDARIALAGWLVLLIPLLQFVKWWKAAAG